MSELGLADTIRALRVKGYIKDFNFSGDILDSHTGKLSASEDEYVIEQVFRFDVMSDPDDQSILYAIHSIKTGHKGILVNGFGIYSETQTNKMVDKLLKSKAETEIELIARLLKAKS